MLWYLHGNLQTAAVWAAFEHRFVNGRNPETRQRFESTFVDLWETAAQNYRAWAERFCERVTFNAVESPRFLIGYSLGGRLAFHALLMQPLLWQGVIIIAADPGSDSASVRSQSLSRDQQWAQRFLHEPWELLLAEWDQQPVFGGRPCCHSRPEASFDRQQVSRLFDVFSKGRQENLQPALAALTTPPVLFISGKDDAKYTAIGETLAASCSCIRPIVIPHAGHRVPWENPAAFITVVQGFLDIA